jgi:hypothetical protein
MRARSRSRSTPTSPPSKLLATFTIEHLFEFYGDDAGWSFEARGVEPEISKVQ